MFFGDIAILIDLSTLLGASFAAADEETEDPATTDPGSPSAASRLAGSEKDDDDAGGHECDPDTAMESLVGRAKGNRGLTTGPSAPATCRPPASELGCLG